MAITDQQLQQIREGYQGAQMDGRITDAYDALIQLGGFVPAQSFPLITYTMTSNVWSYGSTAKRKGPSFNDLEARRLAALAYHWDIPREALGLFLVNLSENKDVAWINEGAWPALWNGVWIIRGTTREHRINVSYKPEGDRGVEPVTFTGFKFLEKFGQRIVESDRFRYGLWLDDEVALDHEVKINPGSTRSHPKTKTINVLRELSNAAAETTIKRSVFVGSFYLVNILSEGENAGVIKASAGSTLVTSEIAEGLASGEKTSGAWASYGGTLEAFKEVLAAAEARLRKRATRALNSLNEASENGASEEDVNRLKEEYEQKQTVAEEFHARAQEAICKAEEEDRMRASPGSEVSAGKPAPPAPPAGG